MSRKNKNERSNWCEEDWGKKSCHVKKTYEIDLLIIGL